MNDYFVLTQGSRVKAKLTDSILSWGVLDADKKALVDWTLSKSIL